MFSNALKSFSSNINSNYTVTPTPASVSGPWKIHDAKKKSTGKEVSIFIFDRKSLDSHSGSLSRSSASSLKRAIEEVVERLKKEASSLARLRHPNILELVEPVEDTRSGGLQFATEHITASLAGLLQEKDEEESRGGVGGRSSRHVVGDGEGNRRRRDIEIDELEIQKGLLQISKALEFLHENAGLVHGNLTPEAIFINAKSDWKVSGLSFLSPPENSNKPTSVVPISLSEVLNVDPRLPRSVQLNLDYASPDFVLDTNLNVSADMFSLGLLIVALYNSPHASPLQANSSTTTYRRLFASSSTIPSASNDFLSSQKLPRDLTSSVLPRLIARRPAQRMTAREFQESAYFDNILVSTIRFLDSLPGKTPTEKAQFMRGLAKVIPSFPKSVLEKKVLPALLEEMKDRELLALILQNIFKIVQLLVSGKRAFTEKILPRLREIFLAPAAQKTPVAPERDPAKEAGLMVLLDNIQIITENCSGKEFHDEILPIVHLAIESPTHSIVDKALRSLPIILPVLDFSTIKSELFPIIASVFSKTSSLGIKVRGLEAFVVLCGGSDTDAGSDGLDGMMGNSNKKSTASALDKYTVQEKIVPLIRAIKTKEPAVMLAALKVLKQIGNIADTEFLAMDILPILWSMSLGPLLNLQQFQSFMDLIRSLSTRVEQEHTKKLQELAGSTSNGASRTDDIMSFGGVSAFGPASGGAENTEDDFERLVQGKVGNGASSNAIDSGWDSMPNSATHQPVRSPSVPVAAAPTFSWSTPAAASPASSMSVLQPQQGPVSRTITPDLSRFDALAPTKTQFSQPLQPSSNAFGSTPMQPTTSMYSSAPLQPQPQQSFQQPQQSAINWSTASGVTSNPWATTSVASNNAFPSMSNMSNSMSTLSMNSQQQRPNMNSSLSSFSLPPPPISSANSGFSMPQQQSFNSAFGGMNQPAKPAAQAQAPKKDLDSWESLL